jgi:hypothetical protein
MTHDELARRVLDAVRGDNARIQQVSAALLSQDEERIKRTFAEVAGVQLTDEQVRSVMAEASTPEQVAAFT